MVVRIGTWNLENLFKPPSKFAPKTDAEYDAKLDALAAAITRMDPHVLAVQEVGDPVALRELADRVGGTWHIETADPEAGTDHAIRVGILSRVVLTQPTQVSAFPDKLRAIQQGDGQDDDITAMGRPALHVGVRLGGVDIEIITAHFKSKLLTFPGGRFSPHDEAERGRFAAYALYRRSAEATTVRAAATDLLTGHPQRAVVVLGDLNDEVEAATTQILNGPPGSEIDTTGFDRPDEGDAQRLWNLAPRIPAEQRFSRIYRGRPELIDHIFVSHALVGKIAQDHVTTDAAGPTPSIDDDPTERRGAPGSDHRPVLASINT
ncbi:endonuclease/exonuclease/phosphatase family protein [Mycobacterium sp.]|uniref:endonuclease/exonuclease/phosphatase family protein n=1 Tax=Mycobacterium sp. TaxID=1785 RepID=UPI003C71B4A9